MFVYCKAFIYDAFTGSKEVVDNTSLLNSKRIPFDDCH